MAFYTHHSATRPRGRPISPACRLVLLSFLLDRSLPMGEVFTESAILEALEQEHVTFGDNDDTIYTPAVVLWAFLSQVLFKEEHRSCLAAVARVCALCNAWDLKPPAYNNGSYCRARGRLPESLFTRLIREVARGCEAAMPAEHLWAERHVKLVDGTTVSMPDTKANQAEYPQSSSQKPGLGYPIMRLVVLMSLATGMASGAAMGPYAGKDVGELALFRQLFDLLDPQDIVLADRYFCSYFMIALLQERGVDIVTRIHQRRDYDFRRGEHLGTKDHIVEWMRPERPDWMDQATYQRIPPSIRVRELNVEVNEPGFRVESLVVVTTLLDGQQYPPDQIASLYRKRWLVELDINALKTTLGMDVLRGHKPEMVRKEVRDCLLAYNLIRKTMLQSALSAGRSPRTMSFTAALQMVAASYTQIGPAPAEQSQRLIEGALKELPGPRVGNRPNRVEPRAVRRRPNSHPLLMKPRDEARAELLRHHPGAPKAMPAHASPRRSAPIETVKA